MSFSHENEQCRLCLSSVIPGKCMFTTEDENKISLATKIMVCTSLIVTSNDDKPQYLCQPCEETLESFFQFRNKCLSSHIRLCFDANIAIDRNSASKNVKEISSLNDSYLKQEKEDFFEEKNEENYNGVLGTLSAAQIDSQLQDEDRYNDGSVQKQQMECANCLNSFTSIEELDEHWNSCGASKIKNSTWHENLSKLNTEVPDENYTDSTVNDLNCDSTVNVVGQSVNFNEKLKLKCLECDEVFTDSKLFHEHLLTHNNGIRYNCTVCLKTFKDHYELKYHMRVHLEDDRYKCKDCGKKFSRPSALRRHVLIHMKVKPHKCKYCSKTFAHSYHLPPHERTHTGEMPYTCRFCSKSFYEYSAKLKHERNHVKSNKMFQCNVCNRMFATHKEMDEHFNSHDNQMVWKCKTCKNEFRKPSALKKHAEMCHNDLVPFKCEICSVSFALHVELKSHINVHTEDFLMD